MGFWRLFPKQSKNFRESTANPEGSTRALNMLLEHVHDVKIGVLEALLQHQPLSDITPDIFEALADVEYVGTELVVFLLERCP